MDIITVFGTVVGGSNPSGCTKVNKNTLSRLSVFFILTSSYPLALIYSGRSECYGTKNTEMDYLLSYCRILLDWVYGSLRILAIGERIRDWGSCLDCSSRNSNCEAHYFRCAPTYSCVGYIQINSSVLQISRQSYFFLRIAPRAISDIITSTCGYSLVV